MYKISYSKYIKQYIGEPKSCLAFKLADKTFEFVYYYDKNNNLNIVFNGHNPDIADSRNIYEFEFFECKLEQIEYHYFDPSRENSFWPSIEIKEKTPRNGDLNHITLHPVHKGRISNLKQKIHLKLNNGNIREKPLKGPERGILKEDPMMLFYINNTYLGVANEDTMTGLLLSRRMTYASASIILSKKTFMYGGNLAVPSEQKEEEFFNFHEKDNGIKQEDGFTLLIKKNMPNFAKIDYGQELMDVARGRKYLSDLKRYADEKGKQGFLIIGNPEFCHKNGQSIYVGFL